MSIVGATYPADPGDLEFIRDVYNSLLGREPDEVGKVTFLNGLSNGEITHRQILHQTLASPEYQAVRRARADEPGEPAGCTRAEAMDVFNQFTRYDGAGKAGYVTNFIGGVSELAISPLLDGASGHVESYPIPGNFHGETLEWVATFRAVLDSRDRFTMFELGAGWGPWCVIGAIAAKQRGIRAIKAVGIEADAGHVDFMRANFSANGLSPAEFEILHGAVGLENGIAYFPKARSADQVYGGAAAYSEEGTSSGPFADFMRGHSELVETVEAIQCFSLSDQLSQYKRVDLVHCDVQGAELELIPNSIDILTRVAKRLVVGTHSFEIDRRLTEVMGLHGWTCEGVSACKMQGAADGPRLVGDGMQVWHNASVG